MPLQLDTRQCAMLLEMGVHVWLPGTDFGVQSGTDVAAAEASPANAPARPQTPRPAANLASLDAGASPAVAALQGAVVGGGLELAASCHIRVADDIRRAVVAVQPDYILHLAASVDPSKAGELIDINVNGTWQLLSACDALGKPCAVLIVGSAASFGEMHPGESGLGGCRAAAGSGRRGQRCPTNRHALGR
jgi:hypothetical protein